MSETKSSPAVIDGQLYLNHEAKKARHVHKRIIDPQEPESNPLKDYFLQKNRIRAASLGADGKDLVTDEKKIKQIDEYATEEYQRGLAEQKRREEDQATITRGERDVLIPEAFNRRRFLESINTQIAIDERNHKDNKPVQPTAIVFEDIDRFKLVNDNFGHDFGDLILKVAGRVNDQSIRSTDMFARYGGEELVDKLTDTHLLGAINVAQRIQENYQNVLLNPDQREGMEDLFPEGYKHPDNFNPYQTLSFGLAVLEPGQTAEEFMKAGDAAMYIAKEVRHQEQALGITKEGSTGKIGLNTGDGIYVINTDHRLITAKLKELDLTDQEQLQNWLRISVGVVPIGFKDTATYVQHIKSREKQMQGSIQFMLKHKTPQETIKKELANYLKIPAAA